MRGVRLDLGHKVVGESMRVTTCHGDGDGSQSEQSGYGRSTKTLVGKYFLKDAGTILNLTKSLVLLQPTHTACFTFRR